MRPQPVLGDIGLPVEVGPPQADRRHEAERDGCDQLELEPPAAGADSRRHERLAGR